MAPPAFSDIAKPTNDIIGKDFFHGVPVALDLKTVTPNGITFTSKGKIAGAASGSLEGKYSDKATGLTLTQGWNTANALDTKIELADALSPGVKAELVTSFLPNASKKSAKLNLYFSQSSVNARAFVDLLKGPVFNGDLSVGQDGFTTGGALAYDVKSATLTGYSGAIGYKAPSYAVSLTASNALSVFSAGYYHKVSPVVEVGAKATYDSKAATSNTVAIEVASKYQLDPTAFVKAKIADSGVLSLALQQTLNPSVKLGLGAAVDTLKLGESAHKFGLSLSFSP